MVRTHPGSLSGKIRNCQYDTKKALRTKQTAMKYTLSTVILPLKVVTSRRGARSPATLVMMKSRCLPYDQYPVEMPSVSAKLAWYSFAMRVYLRLPASIDDTTIVTPDPCKHEICFLFLRRLIHNMNNLAESSRQRLSQPVCGESFSLQVP